MTETSSIECPYCGSAQAPGLRTIRKRLEHQMKEKTE